IAQKIRPVTFSDKPSLPHIDDADAKLREMAYAGIHALCATPCSHGSSCDCEFDTAQFERFSERLEFELAIIREMNFSTYFLILADMVNFAKREGIRVGPGRGSGAGSLVLFAIGVTEVNPLDYDLSFERFLNPY